MSYRQGSYYGQRYSGTNGEKRPAGGESNPPNGSSSNTQGGSSYRRDYYGGYRQGASGSGANHGNNHKYSKYESARDSRDSRDSRDTRDTRDTRDNRDSRDTRDTRDGRDGRDRRRYDSYPKHHHRYDQRYNKYERYGPNPSTDSYKPRDRRPKKEWRDNRDRRDYDGRSEFRPDRDAPLRRNRDQMPSKAPLPGSRVVKKSFSEYKSSKEAAPPRKDSVGSSPDRRSSEDISRKSSDASSSSYRPAESPGYSTVPSKVHSRKSSVAMSASPLSIEDEIKESGGLTEDSNTKEGHGSSVPTKQNHNGGKVEFNDATDNSNSVRQEDQPKVDTIKQESNPNPELAIVDENCNPEISVKQEKSAEVGTAEEKSVDYNAPVDNISHNVAGESVDHQNQEEAQENIQHERINEDKLIDNPIYVKLEKSNIPKETKDLDSEGGNLKEQTERKQADLNSRSPRKPSHVASHEPPVRATPGRPKLPSQSDFKTPTEESNSGVPTSTNDSHLAQTSVSEELEKHDETPTPHKRLLDSSFDTSTLSPIKDTPMSDEYFQTLGSRSKLVENERTRLDAPDNNSDDSEAETVVGDSPPQINKGKRYIRKVEDTNKRKRRIPSSEDEDHEEKRARQEDKPYKIKRDAGGRTMLQRACKKGDVDLIKSYLARGADANEKDFGGFTCLHEAALEGNTEVVELLLDHGADVNAKADAVGAGETPLIDAAENKHYDTVKSLLAHGADPTIYNIDGLNALTKILNDHGDEDGYDAIISLLEEAIEASPRGDTTMKLPQPNDNQREVVEDPHDIYFAELLRKKTIYKHAAEGIKEQTATYFVQGNSLSAKPDVLFLAARNGHVELIDIILGLDSSQFDLDTENDCGTTALLSAVGRGHLDAVESLLSKGADPFKIRSADNRNALQIAETAIKYDAKEVELIQRYMDKRRPTVSRVASRAQSRAPSIAPSDDDKSESEEEEIFVRKRRSVSVASEAPIKRVKSETIPKDDTPEPLKRVRSENMDEDRRRTSTDEERKSLSPSPQMDQPKERDAEQARMWQEKQEAKKRARRDMFLKAEREKERLRKEEEEHRQQEERRREQERDLEQKRRAQEAEEQTRVLEQKRVSMRQQLMAVNYPAGLLAALSSRDKSQFGPLYRFEHNGGKFYLDLQLVLTGIQAETSGIVVSDEDKRRLWSLFYPLIGGKESIITGMSKFGNLLLRFVPEQQVEVANDVIAVDFNALVAPIVLPARNDDVVVDEQAVQARCFVPPNLRSRRDVVRVLSAVSTEMW